VIVVGRAYCSSEARLTREVMCSISAMKSLPQTVIKAFSQES